MSEKYKIGIIGLGYVGLPLAVEFASNSYDVLGFDIKEKRTEALKSSKETVVFDVKSVLPKGQATARL